MKVISRSLKQTKRLASDLVKKILKLNNKQAVVVLANDPWETQWRRKQHLYSRLAQYRPVYYLDPPFSPLDFPRGRRSLVSWLADPVAVHEASGGVRVLAGVMG